MLSERKQQILKAVISHYIRTAEPVGSRTLSRRYKIGLSPATIRNEMADLEEMGYLEQPYTSAGRIPSNQGYRFYVDFLMETADISSFRNHIKEIVKKSLCLEKMKEIDRIIQCTAKMLSSLTKYTSVVVGPQFEKSAFKHMHIIPLGEGKALVTMITEAGFIKNKVIDLPYNLTMAELNQVVRYLNHRLKGLAVDQITSSLINEIKRDLYHRIELLEQALMLIEESLSEEPTRSIFKEGTVNILNQPEFKDVEKIKQVLSLLEEDSLLAALLEVPGECSEKVLVKIGEENALEQARECSLIVATYSIRGKTIGSLGVLGPTRMDYSQVIAVVEYMVEYLNYILEKHISNYN